MEFTPAKDQAHRDELRQQAQAIMARRPAAPMPATSPLLKAQAAMIAMDYVRVWRVIPQT